MFKDAGKAIRPIRNKLALRPLPCTMLALLLSAAAAAADSLAGTARVIDGATLVIEGVLVRLAGVDAPPITTICTRSIDGGPQALPDLRDAVSYPCGQEAADRLRAIVSDEILICRRQGSDDRGRILVRCSTPAVPDIGAALTEPEPVAR